MLKFTIFYSNITTILGHEQDLSHLLPAMNGTDLSSDSGGTRLPKSVPGQAGPMSWQDPSLLRPRIKADLPGSKKKRQPGEEGPPSSTSSKSGKSPEDTDAASDGESLGSQDSDETTSAWTDRVPSSLLFAF